MSAQAQHNETMLYDVVVVGSGMGGAMAASVLARAGLSTLVLESGETHFGSPRRATLAEKFKAKIFSKPKADPVSERWPDPLLMRKSSNSAYREISSVVARIPGGSGQVYGAALARPKRSDFEQDAQPDAWLPGAQPALPNAWPVDFDEMLAYYRRAEQVLRVAGTPDPLDQDDDAALRTPPPVSPTIAKLVRALEANGRHPYRMHVGIDYLPGCKECQGERCARLCKSDTFNRALQDEIAAKRVQLRTGLSVSEVIPRTGGGYDLQAVSTDGTGETIAAHRIVLAGGALNTPLILQRSGKLWARGEVPSIVGAGLMFHFSDMFAVMGAKSKEPAHGALKVLAFRDHYSENGIPMAECQSLGMPSSPWMIAKYLEGEASEIGLGRLPMLRLATDLIGTIADRFFRNVPLFTASIEDLPYAENRVDAVGESVVPGLPRVAVTYDAPAELRIRAKRFRQLMREAFSPFQVRFLKRLGAPNLGHPMGTCRMGSDPATSVTAPDGSVWGHKGLYVVDASVFPSSLGINPALTVAANAMRVAEAIAALTTSRNADARTTGMPCAN